MLLVILIHKPGRTILTAIPILQYLASMWSAVACMFWTFLAQPDMGAQISLFPRGGNHLMQKPSAGKLLVTRVHNKCRKSPHNGALTNQMTIGGFMIHNVANSW